MSNEQPLAAPREFAAEHYPRPALRSTGWLREVLEMIVFVVAIYTLVELAIPRFLVEGPSMQPTFHNEQRLIVSRLNYLFGQPQRGDIVVFNAPGSREGSPPLIKRAIGLPGDTIEIRDRQVFVNGVRLEEPYINEPCDASHCPDGSWQLGPEQYFVMGDNRNHSRDSRSFGPVLRDHLIGEVLVRYWPLPDVGVVEAVGFPRS